MENLHLSVNPAKAGIQWLKVLRDPCFRRDDGEEAFFDTLAGGDAVAHCAKGFLALFTRLPPSPQRKHPLPAGIQRPSVPL
jgi:hypothetical protein